MIIAARFVLVFALEFLDGRLDRLQAPVEGTRVYTKRLRVEL
jgi:hypothetical protein